MNKKKPTRILFKRSSGKSQIKLTNTEQTKELDEIIQAKSQLKSTKRLTTSIERIANELHNIQKQESRTLAILCNRLRNISTNSNNTFSVFLNNMGRVWSNFEELDQIYLTSMKDQLLSPFHQFNTIEIPKCQKIKVKLKTAKGKYDIKKKNENKISLTKHSKRLHRAQSVTVLKLDELDFMRQIFVDSVQSMEASKLFLLSSLQKYMNSYQVYVQIRARHLTFKTNTLIHNNYTDFGKKSIIIKQGYFKFKVNVGFKKKWFKLFANKQLLYFTENGINGILEGHINLTQIISINAHNSNAIHVVIELAEYSQTWIFHFESTEERDSWYTVIQQTCIKGKGISLVEAANKFIDMFQSKNDINITNLENINNVIDLTDFFSINIEFRVICDNVPMYKDKLLMDEIFSIRLEKNKIVEGQYINSKVILLNKFKFYISTKDIEEIPIVLMKNNQYYTGRQYKLKMDPVDPADFIGVKLKFRVVINDIDLYCDKELTIKKLCVKLKENDIIEGKYIGLTKVILLDTFQCYISEMDVVELTIDEYIKL